MAISVGVAANFSSITLPPSPDPAAFANDQAVSPLAGSLAKVRGRPVVKISGFDDQG